MPGAPHRPDRDVLAQTGARTVILLEGVNDIGRERQRQAVNDAIDLDQLLPASAEGRPKAS